MKKKTKAAWTWAPAKQSGKPTEVQMSRISAAFEPLVENIRNNLPPVPEPQQWNHCVDVFTKWRGSYFYLMQKYQCPPGSRVEGFETGVARLEFVGEDAFNLAYLRHNDKWWTLAEGVPLEDCVKAVEGDPWFQVF